MPGYASDNLQARAKLGCLAHVKIFDVNFLIIKTFCFALLLCPTQSCLGRLCQLLLQNFLGNALAPWDRIPLALCTLLASCLACALPLAQTSSNLLVVAKIGTVGLDGAGG